jgi:hypothetical protein
MIFGPKFYDSANTLFAKPSDEIYIGCRVSPDLSADEFFPGP